MLSSSTRPAVVYQLTLRADPSRYYIGSTYKDKWENGYKGSGKILPFIYRKYGRNAFYRAILRHCNTRERADRWETVLVDHEDPNSYNLCPGGRGCGYEDRHGSFGTEQVGKKISKSKLDYYANPDNADAIADSHERLRDYYADPANTKEIEKANKIRADILKTPVVRAKISKSRKEYNANPANDEANRIRQEKANATNNSPEHIAANREQATLRMADPANREAISKTMRLHFENLRKDNALADLFPDK